MTAYSKQFAGIYDAIVYGKDEAYAETDELIFLLGQFNSNNTKKVLDLGCGVGKFLVPLASMEYEMTGIDISQGVLDECAKRLEKRRLEAKLIKLNANKIKFEQEFDTVISMDSVLHYFDTKQKIINVLKRIYKSLKPNGKIIVENRNLLADLNFYNEPKVEHVKTNKIDVEYICKNEFDKEKSLFHIDIIAKVKKNGKIKTFSHNEILRFISPEEMEIFLRKSGFENIEYLPDFRKNKTDDNEIVSFVFTAQK